MDQLPKQTAEIFARLSKGEFICSNSKENHISTLFEVIEAEEIALRTYFSNIDFLLEKGNGYYYFSKRGDKKQDIERKIEQFEKYIDILNYFTFFQPPLLYASNHFTLSGLLHATENNPKLDDALKSIKMVQDKQNFKDKINAVLKQLVEDKFLECIDKQTDRYLVLDSYDYLHQLVDIIKFNENEGFNSSIK
jgi:hypothetical protein